MRTPVLAAERIDTYLGVSHVLRALSFEVLPGEVTGLLGRNGMGKTTLLRTLSGLVRPRRGRVWMDGADVTAERASARARRGLAYVPEDRGVFPNLTVEENLTLPRPSQATRRQWTLNTVYDLFPPLAERRRHFGDRLSGGEQKMLAIGRALMSQPSVLLLDEATEGLAPKIRDTIWSTLRVIRQAGVACVVVDKHIDDLLALADRTVILVKGEVAFAGSSADLAAERDAIHRHLGV